MRRGVVLHIHYGEAGSPSEGLVRLARGIHQGWNRGALGEDKGTARANP
jgi:hypothetical protein